MTKLQDFYTNFAMYIIIYTCILHVLESALYIHVHLYNIYMYMYVLEEKVHCLKYCSDIYIHVHVRMKNNRNKGTFGMGITYMYMYMYPHSTIKF